MAHKYLIEHSDEKYIHHLSESLGKYFPTSQNHVVKRENGKVWIELESVEEYSFLWNSLLDFLSFSKDYWPHDFCAPKVTEV